jgi:hypothetical protein
MRATPITALATSLPTLHGSLKRNLSAVYVFPFKAVYVFPFKDGDTYTQQKHCILHIESDIHAIPRASCQDIRIHRGWNKHARVRNLLLDARAYEPPQRVGRASRRPILFSLTSQPCPLVRLNTHTTQALHKTKADSLAIPYHRRMIHRDVHQQEEDMRKGVGEGRGSGEVSGEGRIGCTLTKFIALWCLVYVLSILAGGLATNLQIAYKLGKRRTS